MRYLITGGCGFIGSHFVELLRYQEPKASILVYDKLTYAGSLDNIAHVENIDTLIADLLDPELEKAMADVDVIVNFAAESHVDNSINDGLPFIQTNIEGTYKILQNMKDHQRLVHISTDEVYGSINSGESDETYTLRPSSPYSASKASADLLVSSHISTHGIDAIITRSSNNYGPRQHVEKFIPTVIRCINEGKAIPFYDGGTQVRDWIHVEDNCIGIYEVMKKGHNEVYNIGSGTGEEIKNIQIIDMISRILDKTAILLPASRAGHDHRYALDTTYIYEDLNWYAMKDLEEGLEETVEWYLKNEA